MRPCVIFDVDGTLCDVRDVRWLVDTSHPDNPGFKHFRKFHNEAAGCPPHEHVASVARALRPDVEPVIVTARKEQHRLQTIWFLRHNRIPFELRNLFMRGDHDDRADFEVKSDILQRIRQRFVPLHAFDDNPNVIELWEREGIPVTRVPGWEE